MNRLLALLLVAWLAPVAAHATCDADSWCTLPDGTSESGAQTTSNLGTKPLYYDFSATTDPPVLRLDGNGVVVVNFNSDESGSGSGAEIQLYDCSEKSYSANHCALVRIVDVDGVVQTRMDGTQGRRTWVVHIAGFLAVHVTQNTGSDDARVTARLLR